LLDRHLATRLALFYRSSTVHQPPIVSIHNTARIVPTTSSSVPLPTVVLLSPSAFC
ncbi:hypothetical protein PanWU01x14_091970, partial [Parasponia andersonii]